MIILLDVDGVVCNFVGGIIASHGLPISHEDYGSWNHHRTLGMSDEEMLRPTNDGKWWTELEEYDWAKRLVLELRRIGEVIFCSSPTLDETCPSQKVAWLRATGLMHAQKNDYQIGPRKELNAKSGAVLVDDSDSNVATYLDHGGTAVLFPQPWNQNADYRGDKVDFVLNQIATTQRDKT